MVVVSQLDGSGYLAHDTIGAVATALGGPVAIIRISGPRAELALETLSSRKITEFLPRRLERVLLRDGVGQKIDDGLAVIFKAPASFTGEDVVELQVHGGSFVVSKIFEELAVLGVRRALPGEFSFRAVRNGKMCVSEAEGVADLIEASNSEAARLALEKMSGTQGRFLAGLIDALENIAAHGELDLDFSDQEVDEQSLVRLQTDLVSVTNKLEALGETIKRGKLLREGLRVALVGLPNSGKSSLFNALLGEDRALVSEVAGTTRDVVHGQLTLQAKTTTVTIRLEDTAGLRETQDHVEKMGIDRTARAAVGADLVVLVIDASVPDCFEILQHETVKIGFNPERALLVFTKTDLCSESRLGELHKITAHLVSSVTGDGVTDLAARIAEFAEKVIKREPNEVILTREEHAMAVAEAVKHLRRAAQTTATELFASDIRQALHALEPLGGTNVLSLGENLLSKIFGRFCIGK
jgi:tRNA modification GTPase